MCCVVVGSGWVINTTLRFHARYDNNDTELEVRWGGVGTAEAGSVLVLLLDEGLEVHHGVQLLGRVAQQTLQVAHEPVHIPATRGDVSWRILNESVL